MKTHPLFHSFLFILVCVWSSSAQAQDQTVSGNLTVSSSATVNGTLNVMGVADFNNDLTYFGTNEGTGGGPGIALTYTDTASGTVSIITFGASSATSIWQWTRNSTNGGLQMRLSDSSNSNILTIYTPTATPSAGIILNPAGISTFSDRIIITGTNSVTATDTTSVLTVGAANNIYLKSSDAVIGYMPLNPGTLAVGYQTVASGPYSVAMGYQTRATGTHSTAFGTGSVASGTFSTAMGYTTTASGHNATAMGFNSIASGSWSTANGYAATTSGLVGISMGAWTAATGDYSVALGKNGLAGGYASTAMGEWTIAQGAHQFAIGRYNLAQGNPTTWVASDDLFIVGNGSSGTARANAFSIRKDGATTITGSLALTGLYSTATINANTSISGNLLVSGQTAITGQLNISGPSRLTGKLTAEGPIHIEPQGDLSMGEFNVESGLNTSESAAKAYIHTLSTAGVILSTNERHNIEDFLSGLDQIVGLNNVTECWSFRSNQNAGSGTTIYGMLGNYTATIVGTGNTWGPEGLTTNMEATNSGYVRVNNGAALLHNNPISSFGVFVSTGTQWSARSYWMYGSMYGQTGVTMNHFRYAQGTGVLNQMHADTEVYFMFVNDDERFFFSNTTLDTDSYCYKNGANQTLRSVPSFPPNPPTGSESYQLGVASPGCSGTVSFHMVVRLNLTAAQHLQIYNLYKSTIGQGLSLP